MDVLAQAVRDRESKSNLSLPLCSVQVLSGSDDAHSRWAWPSALLSLSIQMLISSRNILTDTARNNV